MSGYPDEEINLLDYIRVIKKHRNILFLIVLVTVFTTGIVSLLMTPIYESKVVLAPVTPTSPSPFASLAQQFGISPSSPPIVTDIVALLKSKLLREKVIEKYGLLPYFVKNPRKKTPEELIWDALRALDDSLNVKYIQKDNVIEISFQHKDRVFTAQFLKNLINELNEHMVSEAKRVAETNKNYLVKEVEKTGDPFIKSNIYSLIAQQIQASMMAEAKENFAFKVIDPPKVPDKKAKPKRILMVGVSFVVSIFFGLIVVFSKEYFEKMRERTEEKGVEG
jgi:uncharacterized protein involved in exopolysaccharide biosynthesis